MRCFLWNGNPLPGPDVLDLIQIIEANAVVLPVGQLRPKASKKMCVDTSSNNFVSCLTRCVVAVTSEPKPANLLIGRTSSWQLDSSILRYSTAKMGTVINGLARIAWSKIDVVLYLLRTYSLPGTV